MVEKFAAPGWMGASLFRFFGINMVPVVDLDG